ncbi:hypothetical protein JOQ06_009542 [Pogonophryne albipinna]|uniref:Integrase core domain-containing protein n=1 Tax=Pogonophryne albipinna TaxID=1090488 RepID=A0AAD6FUD5_9TELE|nr:hypothetical protein JOQ06_009542 [Pogonophryne albipinna]
MRLKPDAILLQTDGHRKPPRSELSPWICCFYSRSILEHILKRQILERLLSKFELALIRAPLDLDFLEFACRQELYLLQALSRHVDIPQGIIQALQELFGLLRQYLDSEAPNTAVGSVIGLRGRPKFEIERQQLVEMLGTNLSVPCIAKLLGVSSSTIFRRMREFGLSVSELYSSISDEELDNVVISIKNDMPTAGYRMVKGRLLSIGLRVQWTRMAASMHRVDSIGILSRLASLGCVVRRTYSVRGPLSLVHVDTNHKLIRYNIVLFGGVDGYSRKVMYLGASTNNRASTAYGFFLEATQRHGVPLRVRGDQGVENVQIARFMFSVRGTDRGSFISGKSVHNQRIERLWRDVRVIVINKYSAILLCLEEDGLLDISSTDDLFCTNIDQPESPEEPDVDWEIAADHDGEEEDAGIVVPEFDCPLSPEDITELESVFQQIDPNTPVKELYLLCREYVAERCGS